MDRFITILFKPEIPITVAVDTNNVGNTKANLLLQHQTSVTSTPFNIEDFETAGANTRFTPALVDSGVPDITPALLAESSGC